MIIQIVLVIIMGFSFQRAGAVFPQRSERSAPVFTPPQTQPLTSYPQNLRNRQEAAESSAEPEFPTLRYVLVLSDVRMECIIKITSVH